MRRIFLCFFIFPLVGFAQSGLTGVWRLKESKIVKGPDYTNALPLLITIRQSTNIIELESITNNGETDSISKESITIGIKRVNGNFIKSGVERMLLFYKGDDNVSWIKQTEILSKGHVVGELRSVSKETFRLWPNGKSMNLLREYDSFDDSNGAEDFVIDGVYEKLTPEQVVKGEFTGKGVKFLEGFQWDNILAVAKKENKYVFVDCYASWCRPCKMMDRYVYSNKKVGEAMNEQFVAVKVQMDTTKNDADHTKMYYSLARKLETEYNVSVLPTYLFFSPEGKPVHKAMGQKDIEKFLELLGEVRDPEKQFYTLVEKAKRGEMVWKEYPSFIKRLKESGEKDLAGEVARIYYINYLNNIPKEALLTKTNLDFIDENITIVRSSDILFKLCLEQPRLVDSFKQFEGEGWADYVVKKAISQEDIYPLFGEAEKTGQEPDWEKLEQRLVKKINKEIATTFVLDARMDWYTKKKNWLAFLLYLRPHLARHDLNKINSLYLNSCAWKVFKYSDDTDLINEALVWIDIAISKTSKESLWMTMDTKSCLLYKSGKREEGISVMKQLIQMYPQFNSSFQPRLDSMIKGEDIWLTL